MEIVALDEKARAKAKELHSRDGGQKDGLRIAVVGGGCSGLSYKIYFDDLKEMDEAHEYDNGLVVEIDPKSAVLLQGSVMTYHDGLDGTGFEIKNPNSTGGCGCGKSFSA